MTYSGAADADLLTRTSPNRVRAAARYRASVWSRRTFAVLAASITVCAALAFARWQMIDAVVPWDSKNHFYPMFRFLGASLRQGTLPLWNPYQFGGYPAIADPQSLLFTPSMMLFALLAPNASMPAFDAMIFAHVVAGGIGILALGRRWRWHPAAALLAALVFMFGGSAAARLQHTGMIISYSFFPLALWSLQAALDRRSLRLAIVAGGVAALLALGRDQVAYLLCLALAGSVVRQAFRAESAFAYLRSRAPVILVAGGVTVILMAVPILLTLQFLRDSNRPGVAFGMALEGSLNPVNLLTLIAPNIFGSLDPIYDYWGPGAASIAGNDWTDRSIDYIFAGSLPVVLLAWHGFVGLRLQEKGARFFILLTLCAMFYAFGRHTPAFALAFDWLPGVSLYRRPADATFLANVGLAFLSGYLLHRFIEEGLPRRQSSLVVAVVLALVLIVASAVLIGSALSFAWHAGHLAAACESLLLSCLGLAAIAVVLTISRQPRRRSLAALLLVIVTAGQLVWMNDASPLNAEPASTYSAFNGFYPSQARGLRVLDAELAARRAQGEYPRVEILGIDGSWQNASMVLRLENTVGYNPLRIAEYERAVGVAESAVDLKLRTFPDTFRGYNSRLAALLGLDYLVLDRPIADLPRHIPRPHGTLLFAGDRFYIYRLDGPTAPRAVFATSAQLIDSDDVIDNGSFPSVDLGRDALIDQHDAAHLHNKGLLTAGGSASASKTSITSYGDNRVIIDVQADADGVLILHDLMYPGWQARVDGRSMPVLRCDLLFRGVEVAAGHHTVEFSFHPLSIANLTAAAVGVLRREKP